MLIYGDLIQLYLTLKKGAVNLINAIFAIQKGIDTELCPELPMWTGFRYFRICLFMSHAFVNVAEN